MATQDTKRFIVENHGSFVEPIELFFKEAINLASHENYKRITLLVSSKSTFQGGVIGEFLGAQNALALSGGRALNIGNGIAMDLYTPRTFFASDHFDLVLGIYLTGKDLDLLDSTSFAKAIAYLPWIESDGKSWATTWSPMTWGQSTWKVNQSQLPQSVEEELLHLTKIINLHTGLINSSDKAAAVEIFKQFKKNGVVLSPEDVKQWAVRNGWEPKHADSLLKLAERYCS